MDTRWPPYPSLSAEHVRGATLYATREDQIADLAVPRGGKVAEVGVWRGDFSRVLVDTLKPRQFVAFDIFTGHLEPEWNGKTGHELFDGLTQRQFYERALAASRDITTVVEGSSLETLRGFTDRSFDLVYLDGNHAYDFVKSDAAFATEMVKDGGVLVFNDYMLIDHNNAFYGVVPVVNDMVVHQGWRVVGYALNHGLYCDIALRRASELSAATPPSLLSRLRGAMGI